MSENELMGKFSNFAVEIEPILLPIFFLATGAPVPVTTNSSSLDAEKAIVKSYVVSSEPTVMV